MSYITPSAPSQPAAAYKATVVRRPATLCHCLRVTQQQVEVAIQVTGCQTLADVRACTGAGGGCTACHRRIKNLLTGQQAAAAESNVQSAAS